MLSSSSSMAMSHRVIMSSQAERREANFSVLSFSCFSRFCTFWEFSTSFQKSGLALAVSSSSISLAAASRFSAFSTTSMVGRILFSFTLYSSNWITGMVSTTFHKISYSCA
jgi:hypothetical protein